MSLTAALCPASGPVAAPLIGALRLCGTNALSVMAPIVPPPRRHPSAHYTLLRPVLRSPTRSAERSPSAAAPPVSSSRVASGHHRCAAPVDEQLGADDEIGVIRTEEQHRTRKIDRLAWPVAEVHHLPVGIELVLADGRSDLVRHHAVHADVVLRELDGE